MALWRCEGCTTLYAVGLSHCPRCRGTEFHEEGQRVPKISRHGGPSDKTLPVPDQADQVEQALTDEQATEVRRAVEAGADPLPHGATVHPTVPEEEGGGEPSSPGSSSSASTPKPPTSSEPSKPDHPKRAPKMASRSAKGRTESSTARLMDGGQTAPTSETDSD